MANEERSFSEITPKLQKLAGLADKASEVDPQLYIDYYTVPDPLIICFLLSKKNRASELPPRPLIICIES